MNSQGLLPLLAPLLFVMVGIWFLLIRDLFKILETRHPQKYEAMGRPTLFLRNNISNGLATMKFLLAREHLELKDARLSRLSDFMLAFLIAYLVIFLSVAFLVPTTGRQ
jgi:hypothetical protein